MDRPLACKITPSVQVTFEGVNLNNERCYTYVDAPALNYQYEQYGRTVKLGLKVALF